MTVYFDRCFGKRLPKAIDHTRPPFQVEWHHSSKNNFPQTMTDDKWLEICGQNNWIALSHDRKFHNISVEMEAIRQHKVAAFALCGAEETTWQKLIYFTRAFPRIQAIVSAEKPPFMFRIHTTLRFEKLDI